MPLLLITSTLLVVFQISTLIHFFLLLNTSTLAVTFDKPLLHKTCPRRHQAQVVSFLEALSLKYHILHDFRSLYQCIPIPCVVNLFLLAIPKWGTSWLDTPIWCAYPGLCIDGLAFQEIADNR